MMSGLSLALYNLFRFFAVDLHKDGNQSEDYQTQRPGRNGEQALQHRPQLSLPSRNTALGDALITGGKNVSYDGFEIVPVAFMPDGTSLNNLSE